MLKILSAMPVYQGMRPTAVYCQMLLHIEIGKAMAAGKYSVKPMVLGPRRPIRSARNQVVDVALRTGADRVFMQDDDLKCPKNLLDLLVDADKDIVGALCYTDSGQPCSFVDDGFGHPVNDPDSPKEGLHQRMAVGTGAILIKTDVFRNMAAPWFYYDKAGNSMDVNFCLDAGRAGFEVWVSSDAMCKQIYNPECAVLTPFTEEGDIVQLESLQVTSERLQRDLEVAHLGVKGAAGCL